MSSIYIYAVWQTPLSKATYIYFLLYSCENVWVNDCVCVCPVRSWQVYPALKPDDALDRHSLPMTRLQDKQYR